MHGSETRSSVGEFSDASSTNAHRFSEALVDSFNQLIDSDVTVQLIPGEFHRDRVDLGGSKNLGGIGASEQ